MDGVEIDWRRPAIYPRVSRENVGEIDDTVIEEFD